MEDNAELKRFFENMKEQDRELDIPPFPSYQTKKFNFWIPAGIAASLALLGLIMNEPQPIPEAPREVLIITLQEGENNEQEFVIEEKAYLDVWESPTASLLTDY
ncbi:hypothetical protein [Algoriphagus sp.]|uniref:hypothetical protein n=1 Tax=Algoriphagus sp. TaxID=1872435 RepID=UPI0025E31090|nr:hypothetical protein [Algoriphagus sp.]